ncbi:MAG: type II toxin-antitoxin system RatA family toxin [Maricaulaceae bacterium]|nr:type II toxin-antitoxin system RatA family toxin [Maricaulaceae bacterium]
MSAEIRDRRRIRHSPDDVFDLVTDVRGYPGFIGPMTALRVLEEQVADGSGELTAEARVRFKFVSERFVTRVRYDRASRRVDVSLIEGPFRKLDNAWRIHALADGSALIDFQIRYEFANPLLTMLLQANRERAVTYLVNAFEAEAARRYAQTGLDDAELTLQVPDAFP